VNSEALLDAAGLVADGQEFDPLSLSSSLSTDEERAIADELAVVALIASAHRKLHQVLPEPAEQYTKSSWGHLELIEEVGRGSYGAVYRAWDPKLDRLVALKLFHGARHPEGVMHEGRMLARIRHENVVTVHGADVFEGTAGIWMEFVHGRRLDQIVEQEGTFTVTEAATIGIAVCRALAAVHSAGLLHCDVKAQNIIREAGGRIVLVDLGAGRSSTPDEYSVSQSQIAGTPLYMAPEVFDNGPALAQSDVYSVGVLLFYLVSGRFPVEGKTLGEIKRAHLEKRRTLLVDVRPNVPAEFAREVARAIDPDPPHRHRTPNELEAGLLAVPAANRVPVVPPRAVTRRRAFALIAALTVAASLIAWAAVWRGCAAATSSTVVPATRAVAVLPIRNLTGDPGKAYLADGLTEVLISNLARVQAVTRPVIRRRRGVPRPRRALRRRGQETWRGAAARGFSGGSWLAIADYRAPRGSEHRRSSRASS
jgi:eukaryotic-like serine/threonine-protein kinase